MVIESACCAVPGGEIFVCPECFLKLGTLFTFFFSITSFTCAEELCILLFLQDDTSQSSTSRVLVV